MTRRKPIDDAPHQQPAVPSPATRIRPAQRPWFLALVLAVVTFVAYQPAWHAGFIWDDDVYVSRNPVLRYPGGLGAIWFKPGSTVQYYPLVFTSFWVEHHLWKFQPFGYHLVNVLLHAVNAILLWRVLQRLEVPGSWWAAAIFALHPVNVESVAWITERKNVLSGLFYFLAALAYLRFRPLRAGETACAPHWRFYWLALGMFVCALLSKTVTCSLPAVLVLLIWWKTGRLEKRDGLALAPWFVLGAASGFMTRWMEQRAGASGAEWDLSFVQRCLVAGRALWFYAGKLCWPRHLTFIYPRWEIDAGAAWQYSFPLAALVVLVALWFLRARIGKGPLVAVLFFGVTLVPALGFVNVYPFRYSYVADHFQYLAGIGLIVLAVNTAAVIGQRIANQVRHLFTLAAALLLVLGASTWSQAHVYQNEETLWRDTLAKNPNASMAHNNLGLVLQKLGNVTEAKEQYEQALRLQPDSVEAYNNLGKILFDVNKTVEAIAYYEQALRVEPGFGLAHYNLAVALAKTGRMPEAIGHLEEAVRIKPAFAEAHCSLGIALLRLGKTSEAIAQYEEALRLQPDYFEAHHNLGNALLQSGKVPEAIAQYEQALRIRPDYPEAHYNLGLALARTGRVPEAMGHWEQAVRIKPAFAEAHYNLGLALEQAGKLQDAIGHYEQALRIKPDFTDARNALARLQGGQ